MTDPFTLHQNGVEMFWGEIPPSEHLMQIYDNEQVFLDTLEGFVVGGLRAGDGVILIATGQHLELLEERIRASGVDAGAARDSGQLTGLRAEDVLSQFMVDGWPNERLFKLVVSGLLERARGPGRKVRAFGEMVALLWARGDQGATVRLEFLWHQLCSAERFSLFCAYPRVGFTGDSADCIGELCALHSRMIPGETQSPQPHRHVT
jgi:hypothetical protein